MGDRLEQIRDRWYALRTDSRLAPATVACDVEWLLAEVDRLRTARGVDRLGYVVVEYDPVDWTHRIDDMRLFDRDEALRVRDEADRETNAIGAEFVFTIAEVHETEETAP